MVVVVVEEEEAHMEADHEATRRRTQRRRAPRLRRAWRHAGTGRWCPRKVCIREGRKVACTPS